MVEPINEDQGDPPVTRGVIIASALLILGFLTLMILAQEYESHGLLRTVPVLWYLLVSVFLLGWPTVGTVNVFEPLLKR